MIVLPLRISGYGTVQKKGRWHENRRSEALRQGMRSGISIRQLSRLKGISKAVIEKIKRGM